MIRRIYADTSVLGGCFDAEFREASRLLMDAFNRGDSTIVVSSLTQLELASAPSHVQEMLDRVPLMYREYVEMTEDAEELSYRYIEARAIGEANKLDAQHIAVATVNEVGVLVSWNFKHIVNLQRIRTYNRVNERQGYRPLEIRTPGEVLDYESG